MTDDLLGRISAVLEGYFGVVDDTDGAAFDESPHSAREEACVEHNSLELKFDYPDEVLSYHRSTFQCA